LDGSFFGPPRCLTAVEASRDFITDRWLGRSHPEYSRSPVRQDPRTEHQESLRHEFRDTGSAAARFPGFLRTADGGYIKIDDFLTFVAGASATKTGDTKDRAMAWLRRQGITSPPEHLSPAEVSRLTAAAHTVIVTRKDRERRVIPRPEPEELSSPANDVEPE